MSVSVASSKRSTTTSKFDMQGKIDELQQRILEIRHERNNLNAHGSSSSRSKPGKGPKGPPAPSKLPPIQGDGVDKAKKGRNGKKKEKLYHPNLKLVVAEMAYSPYLIKPEVPYTLSSMRYAPKLAEVRFKTKQKGVKVNKEEVPCSLKEARKTWEQEVKNYTETIGHPGSTRRKPGRRRRAGGDGDSVTSMTTYDDGASVGSLGQMSLSSTAPTAFDLTRVPGGGSPITGTGSPGGFNKTVGATPESEKKKKKKKGRKKKSQAQDQEVATSEVRGTPSGDKSHAHAQDHDEDIDPASDIPMSISIIRSPPSSPLHPLGMIAPVSEKDTSEGPAPVSMDPETVPTEGDVDGVEEEVGEVRDDEQSAVDEQERKVEGGKEVGGEGKSALKENAIEEVIDDLLY